MESVLDVFGPLAARNATLVQRVLEFIGFYIAGDHDLEFLADVVYVVLERFGDLKCGVRSIGVGGLEVCFALVQEVATVLNNVVQSQVNQTYIGLFVGLHEVLAQVVNGWEAVVIVLLGEVGVVKEGVIVVRVVVGVAVFFEQATLIHAYEELGIDLVHLIEEERLQAVEALAPAVVTTTLAALDARAGSGIGRGKESRTPGGLALDVVELAIVVYYAPADGSRAKVEADVIAAGVPKIHVDLSLLVR